MNKAVSWGPISIWHHRILGGLWAVGALIMVGSLAYHLIRYGKWTDYQFWIAATVLLPYIAGGIGLTRGLVWARRTIGALMVIAVLWFLDMVLMFGFHNNIRMLWAMLAGVGVAVYTLGFLIISGTWH